jgi:thioredoxin-like negative regulator of GroEL
MKKVSLLLGALGGAMAGYVFSNGKLREELADAKDAEAAGKILAKHLQQDGKKIGSEVKRFAQSDEVKGNMTKAKKFVAHHAQKIKNDMKAFVVESKMGAKKAVKTAPAKAKKAAAKATKKAAGFSEKSV